MKTTGNDTFPHVELHPDTCNLCSGKVIYVTNDVIYGRQYGSGMCYLCTHCGAYVGTHKPRPDEAMGLLADEPMRKLRNYCHSLFDAVWLKESTTKKRRIARKEAYERLAKLLCVPVETCHFGWFDTDMLQKAKALLEAQI